MKLTKKLSTVEKFIIQNINDEYTTRYCDLHGVFQKHKNDDGKCPFCKKECEVIENLKELQIKYHNEKTVD
jgi:hypothetical protein